MPRAGAAVEVGAEEGAADPLVPKHRAAPEQRGTLGADDASRRPAEEDRIRRVVERAEHAGDVAKRAPFDAPFAERPHRLPPAVDGQANSAGVAHVAGG